MKTEIASVSAEDGVLQTNKWKKKSLEGPDCIQEMVFISF